MSILLWTILTNILGIINYKYFAYINLVGMDGFKNLYNNLSEIFPVNELLAIKSWMIIKGIKNAILTVLYTYFISFWTYHIYFHDWKKSFHDIRLALFIVCTIMSVYSLFEIHYLIGGALGQKILETINPLYMKIADVNKWWPPLLWGGQLRSLFAEPSFLGIFAAMAIPVLASFFFEKKVTLLSVAGTGLYTLLVIMLVLSKARTGTILFGIEFTLLVICILFLHRSEWKRLVSMVMCTLFAFFVGLVIMSQFTSTKNEVTVSSYVSQNVTSVVGNKRSNNARQANVIATFKVGLQHPLFGVGTGLKDMYLDKNLSPEDKQDSEVANWSKMMYEKGPLKSAYPTLNQLAGTFAEQGLVGLLLYLIPIFSIGVLAIKKRKRYFADIRKCCVLISLFALCVAFFSNVATMPFYVMVGIVMLAINDERGNLSA
ncbi:O-antigen ligase family protein [Mitsuokella sp.]